MDLRQLRYFVAVAERGGFGAAASALNVAQSALSRHIRVLEEELGGALLVRGARGVSVTESGKVLLDRGRWLFGAIDDIKSEVRTENREPSGTVRLGAPSSLADILYAPLARLFAAALPARVQFELSEGLTEEMTDRLLRGEVDVALVSAPRRNDHLDYETLVVEQVFVIGPARAIRSLKSGTISRKAFEALPAVVRPPQPQSTFRTRRRRPSGSRKHDDAQADGDGRIGLRPPALLRHPPGSGERQPVGRADPLDARRPRARPAARPPGEPRHARDGDRS